MLEPDRSTPAPTEVTTAAEDVGIPIEESKSSPSDMYLKSISRDLIKADSIVAGVAQELKIEGCMFWKM